MNLEKDSAPTGFYDYLPQMGTIRRKTARRRALIGKLKPGLMKAVGYDVNASVTRRHKAVKAAVKKYGKSSTIKKLNAIAVYTRRTSPAKSKKFKADMKFAQKMKGGAPIDVIRGKLIELWVNGKLTEEEAATLLADTKKILTADYSRTDAALSPFDADEFYHALDDVIQNPEGKK